tara:strand:+ start:2368 stop:2883 length:516 start_codon:yes stop_codon:yes gene_type:complete
MAFYQVRIDPPCIVDEDNTKMDTRKIPGPNPGDAEIDDPNYVIIEQTLEAGVPLTSYKLNADKTALVDSHSGKTESERETLQRQEQEVTEIAQMRAGKVREIKAEAKARLQDLDWKVQRATEEDLLNGNNSAMTAVANEKKAIRDANNAHENALNALTDLNDIKAFVSSDF